MGKSWGNELDLANKCLLVYTPETYGSAKLHLGATYTVDMIVIRYIFWCMSGNFNRCMKEAIKDKANDDRIILLMSTSEDKDQEINGLSS